MVDLRKRKFGVLVISHGSRNEDWNRKVDDAVHAVVCPLPLECVFLELVPGRSIEDGIGRLFIHNVTDIIAIPLFVSSGSAHIQEIGEMLEQKASREGVNIHMTPAFDDAPEVAQMLYDKLRPLSVSPQQEIVLLIGHGSKAEDGQRKWSQVLESLSQQVKELGGFAEVDGALLLPERAAERLAYWNERRPDTAVIVAPLFLSGGYITETVIPSRLEGCRYRYSGEALLPSPLIVHWLERRIAPFLLA